MPIRTTTLSVEERTGVLSLIPFSNRGEEGTQRTTEVRKARTFSVPRLMTSDTIKADELQNIRAFGTESELMQVQQEVQRRLSGPTGLMRNIEYTWEYQRLAAIQGLLLNSDGSTLYDFSAEFGITAPTEVAFNLSAQVLNSLRPIINGIVRGMKRKSQGSFVQGTKIYAICGDNFYDQFVNHVDVVKTFLNWSAAADLRGSQGAAFEAFYFAGVYWFNYRGSDDTSTIAINTDKCRFFPVGAPGVFQVAYAPGESFDFVNTPGKPMYVMPIPDRDRNSFWKMEVYSYPLHICTRPEVLFSGRDGA
jgi:hypothetical protein